MSKNLKRKFKSESFSSFEEENIHEFERRKNMTLQERLREFEILQIRQWGSGWARKPIVKKASFEKIF